MKMEGNHQERIALIAENEALLEEVSPLLKQEFSCINELVIDEETVEKIESFQPQIIIFSCNEVSTAETLYLTLLRTSQKFINCTHESIILCKREEVKKCYNLCKNEIFNDFVLFKPIYEPYRLLLTVFQAIDRRNSRTQQGSQRRDYSQINDKLVAVENGLQNTIDDCTDLHDDINQEQARLNASLGSKLDEFREGLAASAPQNGIEVVDRSKMEQAFNQFKQSKINTVLNSSTQAMREHISHAVKSIAKQKDHLGQTNSEFRKAAGISHKLILLIEDDMTFVEVIKEILESESYLVESAPNGMQALAKLSNLHVDLILSDINMPEMDGLEFLNRLKGSDLYQKIPVIITTGDSSKSSVIEAMSMGAIDYIVKPFERSNFIDRINQVFAK